MVWINKAELHFYEAQHFTTAFIALPCLDNQTTSGGRVKKADQYQKLNCICLNTNNNDIVFA